MRGQATLQQAFAGRSVYDKSGDRYHFLYKKLAQRISLCADVWFKKGLTSSYLGITAHFFGRKDHQRHHVTLAVRRFHHPHTGERVREIVQEVLTEWNIPLRKVFTISTDNGSNMLRAFRTSMMESEKDNSDHQDEAAGDEKDEEDEEEKEEEEEEEESDVDCEADEYDVKESNHEFAFHGFIKQLSCFAHTATGCA